MLSLRYSLRSVYATVYAPETASPSGRLKKACHDHQQACIPLTLMLSLPRRFCSCFRVLASNVAERTLHESAGPSARGTLPCPAWMEVASTPWLPCSNATLSQKGCGHCLVSGGVARVWQPLKVHSAQTQRRADVCWSSPLFSSLLEGEAQLRVAPYACGVTEKVQSLAYPTGWNSVLSTV